jgi:hypothetical protein
MYVPAPFIVKISPKAGPVGGGTSVDITGTNLAKASAVKFGSISATSFKVNSSSSITAVSPAEPAGLVNIRVTTPGGTSPLSKGDRYKVLPTVTSVSPTSGPAAGKTHATIKGTGFGIGKATVIKFGGVKATSISCASSTECTAVTPAHSPEVVDVTATVNKATSARNPPFDQFTFQ